MTEEEKKAVEIIKGLAVYYDDYSLLDEEEIKENESVNKSIELILNLIEKQSKEIENNGYHLGFIDGGIAKRYEYEDKIKAKIDEVDKDENASIPDFMEYAKQKLQSLLEKE